jgi:hypothetical protein
VHDVNTALLHRAYVERICIHELDDENPIACASVSNNKCGCTRHEAMRR